MTEPTNQTPVEPTTPPEEAAPAAPPKEAVAAAKLHSFLTRFTTEARTLLGEIEQYIPASVLQELEHLALAEGESVLKSAL